MDLHFWRMNKKAEAGQVVLEGGDVSFVQQSTLIDVLLMLAGFFPIHAISRLSWRHGIPERGVEEMLRLRAPRHVDCSYWWRQR